MFYTSVSKKLLWSLVLLINFKTLGTGFSIFFLCFFFYFTMFGRSPKKEIPFWDTISSSFFSTKAAQRDFGALSRVVHLNVIYKST